jgi:biotin operon repressor
VEFFDHAPCLFVFHLLDISGRQRQGVENTGLKMSYLNRTFGVEIEFATTLTREQIAVALRGVGLDAIDAGYTHINRIGQWKLVSDGSLHDLGFELVSPVLQGGSGFDAIEKAMAVLARLNCSVNKYCGLHVHVGNAGLSLEAQKRLVDIYARAETTIDNLLPPSRRGPRAANGFANSVVNYNMMKLARATDYVSIAEAISNSNFVSRYCKLNFMPPARRHPTIEFRHHSGTIDPAKIIAWVKFCLRMVQAAAKQQVNPNQGNLPLMVQAVGEPNGPTKLKKIYAMAIRPEGVSRLEVAQMLNRTSLPKLAEYLKQHGVDFRVVRNRYYVSGTMAQEIVQSWPFVEPNLATLDGLMTKLEASDEERAFWNQRAIDLATLPALQEAA